MEQATEQDRQRRRLAMPYEVNRILAGSRDLEEAAPRILRALGEGLDWGYAGLWTVDRREGVLRCARTWHAPSAGCPEFEAISRRITFAAGVGLPGRVWASGEPDWIADVSRDANFPRMMVAASEGLRSAAAFPIVLGGRVLGVFELLARQLREADPEILEMMASLGGQLGQLLERERSREAVEESEARKAAMLETALDAIVTMNHDGRVVEWNPAAERTFGYAREQAVGREMAELIIPLPLRERHRRGLARYLATGEGAVIGRRIEITAMRSDGSEFPVELAITRVPLGGPGLFTGYIRDITERKHAQEDLDFQRSILEAQGEASIDGILLVSRGRDIFRFNRRYVQLWRIPDDIAASGSCDLVMEYVLAQLADRGAFLGLVHYLHEHPEEDSHDEVLLRDGRIFERYSAPVKGREGARYGRVWHFRDITERKRAEEGLRRSEASLAEAQRIAHLGNWEWNLDSGEVRWSDEAYRIYGFEPGEIDPTYETFWNLVHPEDREYVREAIHAALHHGQPYDFEHRIVRPDGETRTVSRQGEVARDATERPVRVVGTVLDITERRRAQEEVERALELRNRFLSIASHELRTPVTMIKGYAQVLRRRAEQGGDTGLLRPLEVVNRQVDRMAALIDDLLEVSRIESGRLEFEQAPFDLGDALREVVDEVAMATPGFALRVDERVKDLWVRGDWVRIQRVVTNLLTNAVKYSGERKEVDIALGREGDRAVVSVTDYGIGIPREQQHQVFELYFRASNVSSGHYGGLGLGLYISKTIVERHGGEMWVESRETGGSIFRFSLPLLYEGADTARDGAV